MTGGTPPWTEARVLTALRDRFDATPRPGVPARWLFASHVGLTPGTRPSRVIDAVIVDTWPSGQFACHGFEVKITRADWLRELRDPRKGAEALSLCTTMSLVAPEGVLRGLGELPNGWGYYRVSETGVVRMVRRPDEIGLSGPTIDRATAVTVMCAIARRGTGAGGTR